jgi:hypothetical protein
MALHRLVGLVLAAVLVAPAAFGQGMSVGGGAFDTVDPFSSDPFAAATGDFGVDDPAHDGPDFTGRDALAVLRELHPDSLDLPEGLEVVTMEEAQPSRFDQSLGAVGEVRLRLGGNGGDSAVVWRAFEDPGSAVAALPRLADSARQRFPGAKIAEVHPTLGEEGFTCALAKPAADRVNVTCGLSIALDPLQSIGVVDVIVKKGDDQDKLVERAAELAAWGRDRWTKFQNERHSG